jgi:hypothetical protein
MSFFRYSQRAQRRRSRDDVGDASRPRDPAPMRWSSRRCQHLLVFVDKRIAPNGMPVSVPLHVFRPVQYSRLDGFPNLPGASETLPRQAEF